MLSEACSSLNHTVAKLLLECGASPNICLATAHSNQSNYIPLICLIESANLTSSSKKYTNEEIIQAIIEELLKYNVDINLKNKEGESYLSITDKNNPKYRYFWHNREEMRDRLHNIFNVLTNKNVESRSHNTKTVTEFDYSI